MPIDPHVGINAGTIAGLVARDNDLDRRLRALEAARSIIGQGSIDSTKVGEGAIQTPHLAANAVTANHISAGSIAAGHLQAGIISASHIQANAIESHHIKSESIQAGHIAAGSIQAGHLAAGSVTAGTIAAGAITAAAIATGAITADKLNVGNLSTITSDLGNITAGTITGATFQTSAGAAKVVLNSSGLTAYGLDGVTEIFKIDAGTGIAYFTGVAELDPGSIVPGYAIPADAIVSSHIAAGAIQANHIAAGAITANAIDIQWGGHNMLWNSSFEDAMDGTHMWDSVNAAMVVADDEVVPVSGKKVLRITASEPVDGPQVTNVITNPNAQGQATPPNVISGWRVHSTNDADFQQVTVDGAPAFRLLRDTDGGGQQTIYMDTNPDIPVKVGDWVALACEMRKDGAVTASRTATLNVIGQPSNTNDAGASLTLTTSWQRVSCVGQVDSAGDTTASFRIHVLSAAEGEKFYVRRVIGVVASSQAEAEAGIATYFDGDTPGCRWAGTPHASASQLIVADIGVITTDDAEVDDAYPGSFGGQYPGYYALIPNLHYSFAYYVASKTAVRQAYAKLNWYDSLLRQKLPAPTIESATVGTGGSFTSSTTSVCVSVLNANGETEASNVEEVSLPNGGKITLQVGVPADADGTPYPATKLRVYATNPSLSQWSYWDFEDVVAGATNEIVVTGSSPAGSVNDPPATNTAWTVEQAETLSDPIDTMVPSTNPNVASMTRPDLMTTPLLMTGGPLGTIKYAHWVRPRMEGVEVPDGAAYVRPEAVIEGAMVGEEHWLDAFQLEPGDINGWYAPRNDEVLPGSVGSTKITPNSITSDHILAGSITADRLNVDELSVISENAGHITAGTIEGVTITGSTIQTAETGYRIIIDSGGLRHLDGFGETVVDLSLGYLTLGTPPDGHMTLGPYGIYGYDFLGGNHTLTIDSRGNITNILSGSSYNLIQWVSSPAYQTVAQIDVQEGATGYTGIPGVNENILSLRSKTSDGNTAARTQIMAYNKAGLGSTYVLLAAEYTEANGNWLWFRNAGNAGHIMTHDGKSSFIQAGGRSRWAVRYGLYNQMGSGGWTIGPQLSAGSVWDFGAGNVLFGNNPSNWIIDAYFDMTGGGYADFCSIAFWNMTGSTIGIQVGNNHHAATAVTSVFIQAQGADWT